MEEEGFAKELREIRSAEAEKAKILAQAQKDAHPATRHEMAPALLLGQNLPKIILL